MNRTALAPNRIPFSLAASTTQQEVIPFAICGLAVCITQGVVRIYLTPTGTPGSQIPDAVVSDPSKPVVLPLKPGLYSITLAPGGYVWPVRGMIVPLEAD